MGEKCWTAKKYRPVIRNEGGEGRPGHEVYDTINAARHEKLTSGSDGSVLFEEQIGAAAWIILSGPEHFRKVCYLMSGVSKVTAY